MPTPDFISRFHVAGGNGTAGERERIPLRKHFMKLTWIGLRVMMELMMTMVMALAIRMLARTEKTTIVATVQTKYYISLQGLS